MLKNSAVVALAVIAVLETLALYDLSSPPAPAPRAKQIAYSDFVHEVDAGQVSSVSIQGAGLTGKTKDNQRFQTYLPDDPTLVPHLVSANVRVVAMPTTDSDTVLKAFLQWVPLLSIVGIWGWYLSRISHAIPGVSAAIRTLPSKPAARDEV